MQEEALAVTGFQDPEEAARAILARPGTHTEWCVVKLGARGALLCIAGHDTAYYQAALEVWSLLCWGIERWRYSYSSLTDLLLRITGFLLPIGMTPPAIWPRGRSAVPVLASLSKDG
jgi:hypothetical protein